MIRVAKDNEHMRKLKRDAHEEIMLTEPLEPTTKESST